MSAILLASALTSVLSVPLTDIVLLRDTMSA
jgi:hypothetical protein